MGETDILKAIQLLPGVQGGGEGGSGLYVRGGGPDQNLILLDGAPVYNVSHLFGFFSVFNADAIKNVSLYTGGFPARYGGAYKKR
jgi:outer membrane cobalamin receptor